MNPRKIRWLECGLLTLLCIGSLFGIYLFSIGPVMIAASKLSSSGSKIITSPMEKAQKFYQPWWQIRSHCPAPVRYVIDANTALWFRGQP